MTAASRLAGLSSFGDAIIEMTEIRIDSTVWIGSHRSLADSYPYVSSPGGCRMLRRARARGCHGTWVRCAGGTASRQSNPCPHSRHAMARRTICRRGHRNRCWGATSCSKISSSAARSGSPSGTLARLRRSLPRCHRREHRAGERRWCEDSQRPGKLGMVWAAWRANALQRVWRSHEHDLPHERIAVVLEAGREALHGAPAQVFQLLHQQ